MSVAAQEENKTMHLGSQRSQCRIPILASTLIMAVTVTGCVSPGEPDDIGQDRLAVAASHQHERDPHRRHQGGSLARVAFPPRYSATTSPTIRIHGTSRDNADIVGITANGVAADSTDGFATWSVEVPLEFGANKVDVMATVFDHDRLHEHRVDRLTVGRDVELSWPQSLTVDTTGNRAFIIDVALHALLVVDLDTGAGRLVSSAERGTGTALTYPGAVAFDASRNRALVMENFVHGVLAVDLVTGDRSVLTSADAGTGPAFIAPHNIVVDAASDRALVVDSGLAAVIAVDLATGARSVMSGMGVGTGQAFQGPRGITLDDVGNRLLVTDVATDLVLAVDLATGNRTILRDESTGSGRLDFMTDIVLDRPNNRALILNGSNSISVSELDLDTGARQRLVYANLGVGLTNRDVEGIAADSAHGRILLTSPGALLGVLPVPVGSQLHETVFAQINGMRIGTGPSLLIGGDGMRVGTDRRMLVLERGQQSLFTVNDRTGDRELLLDLSAAFRYGAGPELDDDGRILVGASYHDDVESVYSFDLATGEYTLVSDLDDPGPFYEGMADFAYDQTTRQVLVITEDEGLFAIDRDTGVRTLVSSEERGSGPRFRESIMLQHDPARGRVLVTDEDEEAIRSVDLATGNRELIFDDILLPTNPEEEDDPEPAHLSFIAIDPTRDQAVGTDRNDGIIYVLDLATGTHTLLSSPFQGLGPRLQWIDSLFLDTARDYIMVTDRRIGGLVAVDRLTGDRVVVSR